MRWTQIVPITLASLLLLVTTLVGAQEYEEVSYADLVQKLNRKKTSLKSLDESHSLDQIMIHAGAGLVSGLATYTYGGSEQVRQHSGIQLSFGIDLFSPSWMAEAALRNFGTGQSGTETRSLRETSMKIYYRSLSQKSTRLRFGTGIATRYLKVSDDFNGLAINETTPAFLGSVGIDSYINKNFSLGIEGMFRTAMLGSTFDKNSFDLMLRFDTYF
jgi:hypothetical protein